MLRSLFSGVSGLKNHQTAQDVVANNIANVNTTGFKASTAGFQDIVSQTVSAASAPTGTAPNTTLGGKNAKQIGLGVTIAGIGKDMTEGSTQTTDRPLDFAIHGEGYFVVKNGTQTYYTRNGNLTVDKSGDLVTANGDLVQGLVLTTPVATTGGIPADLATPTTPTTPPGVDKTKLANIVIDGGKYSDYAVDQNGFVIATERTSGTKMYLGRLVLGTFNNPAGLDAKGNSCFQPSNNSGDPVFYQVGASGAGTLQSGELEMSNVSLASEMTNMIIIQRGFQANSRVITTSDTMLEELINLKR
jgi:flagellar hook protein FlgE